MISFSCVQTSPIRASIVPSASFYPLVEKASSSGEHTKTINQINPHLTLRHRAHVQLVRVVTLARDDAKRRRRYRR
jgi:hypothetical protein